MDYRCAREIRDDIDRIHRSVISVLDLYLQEDDETRERRFYEEGDIYSDFHKKLAKYLDVLQTLSGLRDEVDCYIDDDEDDD